MSNFPPGTAAGSGPLMLPGLSTGAAAVAIVRLLGPLLEPQRFLVAPIYRPHGTVDDPLQTWRWRVERQARDRQAVR